MPHRVVAAVHATVVDITVDPATGAVRGSGLRTYSACDTSVNVDPSVDAAVAKPRYAVCTAVYADPNRVTPRILLRRYSVAFIYSTITGLVMDDIVITKWQALVDKNLSGFDNSIDSK